MVAISSQPVVLPQSSNAAPVADLRAVPEQETTISSQDNTVAAPQSTQPSTTERPPQPEPPVEPTQVVSQADQEFRRAAVESTAVVRSPERNVPATDQPDTTPRQVDSPANDNRRVEAEATREPVAQAPAEAPAEAPAPLTVSNDALAAYERVRGLSSDNRPLPAGEDTTDSEAVAANTTPQTEQPREDQPISTEEQVFGGAIDPTRQ